LIVSWILKLISHVHVDLLVICDLFRGITKVERGVRGTRKTERGVRGTRKAERGVRGTFAPWQLWGYKVEEKLYLGVREQKRLNTTDLGDYTASQPSTFSLL
jgi:hypothetical protein